MFEETEWKMIDWRNERIKRLSEEKWSGITLMLLAVLIAIIDFYSGLCLGTATTLYLASAIIGIMGATGFLVACLGKS